MAEPGGLPSMGSHFFHQLATPVDLSGLALGVWGSGALVATLGFLSGDPLLSNYLGAVALGLGSNTEQAAAI